MEQQSEGAILNAVQSGDIATVKKFLDEGVPVDLTDEEGWSLLHHAAALGQVEVINHLREKGCHVDLIDNEGCTPLHYAATNGDIETIRLLIAMGSNVNSVDNKGNTPLKWSVMYEEDAAIEELTKHGGTVEIEEINAKGLCPMNLAKHRTLPLKRNSLPNTIEYDSEYCSIAKKPRCNNRIKLSVMSEQNAVIEVDLINHGGTVKIEEMEPSADYLDKAALILLFPFQDPGHILGDGNNEVCQSNQTELTTDIQHVNTSIVSNDSYEHSDHNSHQTDLVTAQQYRDTNADTIQLEEDIFEAAQCGDTVTVKVKLDLGVPVDVTDEDGWSPVHHAIAHRQVEVIRLLMDRGCLMNPVKSKKYLSKEERVTHTSEAIIFEAAQCGDTATVKGCLDLGVPVDLTDEAGWSLLHHAAALGQVEVINLLCEKGCHVDLIDNEGRTPLHYAATNGDIETIRLLLAMGSNVNSVDNEGNTPLNWSVMCEQNAAIEELTKHGGIVEIEGIDAKGVCPMNLVKHRTLPLKRNSLPNIIKYDSEYCLIAKKPRCNNRIKLSVMSEQNAAIEDDLINHGGTVKIEEMEPPADNLDRLALLFPYQDPGHILGDGNNEVCQSNHTELTTDIQHVSTAAKSNDSYKHSDHNSLQTDLVTTNQDMDTNADTTHLEGDIFEAAQCGDTATVKGYLDLGVPVDVTDEDGLSPVHHAIAHRQVEVIRLLMDRGCLMNSVKYRKQATKSSDVHKTREGVSQYSTYNERQLYYDYVLEAARCGDTATIQSYLNSGGPVGLTDEDGRTLLHCAAGEGQIKVVELLIKRGCRIDPVDKNGWTPLDYATACGHVQTVQLLRQQLNEHCQRQYSTDSVDSGGWSVLHFAAASGDIHMIEILSGQGLDINIGDNEGTTPLHCAAACGQLESLCILLRLGGRKSMTKVVSTGGTPLHQAVGKGHKDIVSLLLNEGCPINVVNSEGASVIHFAALFGQIHLIELLSEQGLDVNIDDDEGLTPLHYAATNGQLESVRTLLKLGGRESMTKVSGTGGTPLHLAIGKGHKDIVSLLLNEGCPINVVNSEGASVLHYAALLAQIHLIELLSEQGLDVNIDDDEGPTPLHCVATNGQLESGPTLLKLGGRESMIKVSGTGGTPLHLAVGKGHKDIVSLLLNEGCPINVVNSEGASVLHYAAHFGQIHLIEMLSEQGLDVSIGDDKGWTPLHYAAVNGQLESVRTLLKLGGRESMTKVSGTGGTPLHLAVAGGHKDIVSLLLNEGCPINVVNSEGASVLHIAILHGQIHLIEMLAEQGLDVNIGDDKGWTPLHYAAAYGQLESVHKLLWLGGRKSVEEVAGKHGTPLHLAVAGGHKDIVSLLLNEGCPINVVDSEGASVLHCAGQYGHFHMMEMLSREGLDVNISDDEGHTPLHYAAACGQLGSVRTLLRLGGRKSVEEVAGKHGTPLHQAVARGDMDIVSLLLDEGCPINVVDSEGRSVLHYAAQYGQVHNETIFKKLVDFGGNIHLSDNFGMKFSDVIIMWYDFEIIKQFCVACGLECDDESPLGVISVLSDNNLLDVNRILCLAAVLGNISVFDAMVTSSYPLNKQRMPKIAKLLSLEYGEKLPDQFHATEEPLNPLHISILFIFFFISKYPNLRFLFSSSRNIEFIEKLTSHPRRQFTVNDLFPNGLSPLDVARRFELHDIAVIIERAGGGPGAWADLPKEIEDKAIDLFTSWKELEGRKFGEKAASKILSMLGYQVLEGEGLCDAKKKFLKERPVLHLLDEQFLLHIKSKGKWKRVGRLLKVDEDTLKGISEEATDYDDAYYSMLEHWLEHGHNVSWKTLLDAVGKFETKETVDDITDKIVKELAPSQVSIQIRSFHFKLHTCSTTHIHNHTTSLYQPTVSIHLQCLYSGFYKNGFNVSFFSFRKDP